MPLVFVSQLESICTHFQRQWNLSDTRFQVTMEFGCHWCSCSCRSWSKFALTSNSQWNTIGIVRGGGLESGALPKFVDRFCVTDTQCRELSAKDEEHIYHNLVDHLPQFDMTYEV